MGGKLSPIIIVVLVIVVVALAMVIFGVMNGIGGLDIGGDNQETQDDFESRPKPVLNLEKDLEEGEENLNSVTITATATIEDEEGINEIILPDGTSVKGDTATFEATENKEYTFKVNAVNGKSDTLSITVTEIAERSSRNPYIPEGFEVISNDIDGGFVIEDEYSNQYVWVPVESGKLTRGTMLDGKYEESSTSATSLVNSVAKYYGFYVARFEASKYELNGESVAASMQGKTPWTNINYLDAMDYANKAGEQFGYEDCNTTLMNSYAWDTTLEWIDKFYTGYSSNTNYGNYSYTVYPTGTTELDNVNNICDLAGNVREWTTEIYKDSSNNNTGGVKQRVIRGGSANLRRTPSSHIGYPENTSETYWGFRLILYKQ